MWLSDTSLQINQEFLFD